MPGTDGLSQRRASRQRKIGDPSPQKPSGALDENQRATEDDFMLDDDGSISPTRSHSTSIRRANASPQPRTTASQISPIPQRRTGGQIPRPEQSTTSLPTPLSTQPYPRGKITRQQTPRANILKGKVHWLLPLGIGMIAMLVLWELGSFLLAWGIARYDDIRYGYPRTYQTDSVVGHGNDSSLHPSHFMAVNLNRQAIVIEFPAGNPSGAQSYVVPYYILGQGGDLTPITLEFRDVTGDSKSDMIIHIQLQTQDQTFVFVNDGTKFRPPNSKDNIHL